MNNCPVQPPAAQATAQAQDLTRTIRKLRRELSNCDRCPTLDNCQILKELSTATNTAINEIIEEWNLIPATVN